MKLIKTSLLSAIVTLIRISAGFFVSKFVAVFTGPTGIALIGQFSNFITITLVIANGAINNGVVKYTSEYEGDYDKSRNLFSTSLRISVFCSLFVGFCLIFSASYIAKLLFTNEEYNNVFRVFGFTIILYSLNSLLLSILNGKKHINSFTIVNIAGTIFSLILTLLLLLFYKIEGALYSLILSQTLIFFITVFFILKSDWFEWNYFIQPFDKIIAKKLGSYSIMAIVTALTIPVSQILLRRIIIDKLGIEASGYWQGINKISDGYLLLVTTSLNTYYLPKLSSIKNDGDIRKEIIKGYKVILPFTVITCLLIYFSRFFIITTLYTASFLQMEKLFIYQLIGDFFKIAAWILAYLMLAKAMTVVYILTEIVFSFTFIIISYYCMEYWKLEGITVAFLMNYVLYFFVMILVFRKILFKK